MASKCRKFVPNMFNKTKCQACFGSKEAHSAAALENNMAARKVSKCGYLFVAPNFDFSNPQDRTRRWQRRFFRLYDDGELTFCVDDHMDTVPQGSVDMNKCTDILEAEVITSHCHSLAVVTPDKTEYIKADSKEEIQWWHDVLVKFPNSLKALKTRRKPNYVINSNKENVKPTQNEENAKKPPPAPVKSEAPPSEKTPRGQHQQGTDSTDLTTPCSAFKGVRSLKHKADKDRQEGLRKSSSLHDLTSEDKVTTSLASSRFLSCSGDRLEALDDDEGGRRKSREGFSTDSQFRTPRHSCPSSLPSGSGSVPVSHPSAFNSSSSLSSTSSTGSVFRSSEDRGSTSRTKSREQGVQNSREAPGLKDSSPGLPASREPGVAEGGERRTMSSGSSLRQDADDLSQNMSADETESNETDELKDLVYMKKGWLVKQGSTDREYRKHWFVLAGNALSYYRDAKAEETNNLDGRIDLSTCYEVSEVATARNYGVKIKTHNGEYTLAAMTAGIRSNWMKALRLCMDLHSSTPTLPNLASSLAGKTLAALTPFSADDFDTAAAASGLTSATSMGTGGKGETAFQLVGRRDPVKKEGRSPRRHHSEGTVGSTGKLFSLAELVDQDAVDAVSSAAAGSVTGDGSKLSSIQPSPSDHDLDNTPESSPKTSKGQRYNSGSSTDSSSWSFGGRPLLKRYVEGSDSVATAPVLPTAENRRSKRNISSENVKEDEKREATLSAKTPTTRIKEKSRAAKTPRLHSPPHSEEDLECHRSSGSGQDVTSQLTSDDDNDLNITISSEENYHSCGDPENPEDGHADSLAEGSMMVEMLESEVESLKERLDHTQSELVKMHETNIDLKSRLQKEAAQLADSGYGSGRWSQSSGQQTDASQTTLKRQLKEARDTVQKQRVEIESLKSKLDMSVSKLTGTEKALSEALREYKQEKDKLLKMSSEWNRRIRTLEGQVKDSTHKQERIRESLLNKERECRRLETEAKQHQQKAREQDREILKLKAVENAYNQLKEQLDNRDRDLHHIHTQLHDKDSMMDKVRAEYDQQIRDMENEFSRERDDLENHLEELKKHLQTAEEQQCSLEKNMSTNLADLLKEKDEIIAQLEEKLIEHDSKMVDMQEELQAEMGENSELAHNLEILQEEKHKLQERVVTMETQVLSLKSQVVDKEKDNASLRQKLDKVQQEKTQLSTTLKTTPTTSDPEKLQLEKTVHDLNRQIQGLQVKLMERLEDLDNNSATKSEQQDGSHNIFTVDSNLKEVNVLLSRLHSRFQDYLSTLKGDTKEASGLGDMVKEVCQRCTVLHQSVQEGSRSLLPSSSGDDYQHTISVSASSSSSAILEEYHSLKTKFDHVVAEVNKLKREVNEAHHSYDVLEKKDKKLRERAEVMEKSYGDQMKTLEQRVHRLTERQTTQHAEQGSPAKKTSSTPSSPQATDMEQVLNQLEGQIQALEQTLTPVCSEVAPGHLHTDRAQTHARASAHENPVLVSRLQDLHHQLENISKELKDSVTDLPKSNTGLVSKHQSLGSRLEECNRKVNRLTHSPSDTVSTSPGIRKGEGARDSGSGCATSSMGLCLQTIMDRLQEIGEQLDCIEDHDDDSDDEGDETSVEEVRENLASLCEFVKHHSAFSDVDWRVMQLVSAQKAVISGDRLQAGEQHGTSTMNKLQAYADRLSLEALVLVEMAHLLERKKTEKDKDPLLQEMALLNSKVLSLHQKLDQEMKTMKEADTSVDVLRVQADVMAEKIMMEGQLCAPDVTVSQDPKAEAPDEDQSESSQVKQLAAEAIMRSQLDAFIGSNLDASCDELWSSASHLTTRSLVQGELAFALNVLKQQLTDSSQGPQSTGGVRELYLQRLKDRHRTVMEMAEVYQQKMIQAFATIIFKDSEDLTIMEGSDSVLDTVCSEISSVMEKHIQHCKVKVRTAQLTCTAHRWDLMVNQLRKDRDLVLAGIRQRHMACVRDASNAKRLEIPCQSLDTSITSFGEIMSLRSVLAAHLDFLLEQLKMGSSGLVEGEEEEEEEGEGEGEAHRTLRDRLCSFVHEVAEGLREQSRCRQNQAQQMATDKGVVAASIPNIPHPKMASPHHSTLMREAVFSAQMTFVIYKLKLLHQQEMEAVKVAHPVRRYRQSLADQQDVNRDVSQTLAPLAELVETKHGDDMNTLRGIASQVGRLGAVVGAHDWQQVEQHVKQLEQKLREEVNLAEQHHQGHVTLFKQEQKKVEQTMKECRKECDQFEERCAALEVELRSISHEHDDEVERMRQDVMTAVSAIRANEGQSDTQLSDRVQLLTNQMALQRDMYMRFLEHLRGQVGGADTKVLLDLLDRQLKDIVDSTPLMEADAVLPATCHPSPVSPQSDDKAAKMKEELELLKKEKEEALAEETRNTKAALDAMRKAYEEELQQERAKYRECLLTMYNEDFLNEIRHRHRVELEKTREELKQVKGEYLGRCEDLKVLEIRLAQTKQDYEAHINQLVLSNSQLDEMVNKEIDNLKDFKKKRTASQSSTSATMEEELYDSQITIRVKDTELQKLRSQVTNLENSLHRTTEEHKQTMTQYLQALKENQELRKEFHTETSALQDQLDRVLSESGLKKPVKRVPSFQQRTPSPCAGVSPHRVSTSSEQASQDPNQQKPSDLKDLRRSKSSPSIPVVFNAKGTTPTLKLPSKRDRRLSQRI